MKKNAMLVLMITMLASLLQLGCGGSIVLTDVWTNPSYAVQKADKILVVGLAPREQTRSIFEHQLMHEFTTRGVDAVASVDVVPKGENLSLETFDRYFGNQGIDFVLVTGLVSADTVESYQPGNTYVTAPGGYYGSWYGYYGAHYNVYSEPGYIVTYTDYRMESTLYETSSGQLVWRGLSTAYDPENAIEVVQGLSKKLVTRLGADGFVSLSE